MKELTIWSEIKSLLVSYNFKDEEDIKVFRKALDKQLNQSSVERVKIKQNSHHIFSFIIMLHRTIPGWVSSKTFSLKTNLSIHSI